jgi:hypothetical protein
MIRRQYGLLILVAFLGGLTGGLVSTKFLSDEVVFAQSEEKQPNRGQIYAKTIIAEEYFLHGRTKADSLDSEIPVPRALLTTGPDGNPKLMLQDSNGNPRFSISLSDKDGSTIEILDMNGQKKALLSEKCSYGEKQAGPALALLDDNGVIRAQIGVQPDSNPFISLSDSVKKDKKAGRSIKLCLKEKDKASISLCGIEGRQRAELAVDSENTCLSIKDVNGKTRTELGNTELTFAQDGLLEKSSSGALPIEKRAPSSLVLYNKKGKVLWSAP